MPKVSYEQLTRDELIQLNESLIKAKLIDKYDSDELKKVYFEKETMVQLLNRPRNILLDGGRAYCEIIKEGENVKVYLDDLEVEGVEASADFISDFLPDFTFPVLFYDSVKRQKEAQAAYKCAVIISAIDSKLKPAFEYLIDNYDFVKCRGTVDRMMYKTFEEILTKMIQEKSLLVKCLISACNYKISDFKKKLNPSFISGLSSRQISELSALKLERLTIIRRYSDLEAKVTKRWQKAEKRDLRDTEIQELYLKFGYIGQISLALKLNSDCLSAVDKDIAANCALVECQQYYNLDDFELPDETEIEEYNQRLKLYKKFSFQQVVDKYRREEIETVLKDHTHIVVSKR